MNIAAIKWGAIFLLFVAAVSGSAYVAWDYRDKAAKLEVVEAREKLQTELIDKVQRKLEEEEKARESVRAAIDSLQGQLQAATATQQRQFTAINSAFAADRARNAEFYSRPLPEEGWKAWVHARSLAAGAAAPPSSPSSSPQR